MVKVEYETRCFTANVLIWTLHSTFQGHGGKTWISKSLIGMTCSGVKPGSSVADPGDQETRIQSRTSLHRTGLGSLLLTCPCSFISTVESWPKLWGFFSICCVLNETKKPYSVWLVFFKCFSHKIAATLHSGVCHVLEMTQRNMFVFVSVSENVWCIADSVTTRRYMHLNISLWGHAKGTFNYPTYCWAVRVPILRAATPLQGRPIHLRGPQMINAAGKKENTKWNHMSALEERRNLCCNYQQFISKLRCRLHLYAKQIQEWDTSSHVWQKANNSFSKCAPMLHMWPKRLSHFVVS